MYLPGPVGRAEGQGRVGGGGWGVGEIGRGLLNNSCGFLRAAFAVGAFDFLGACCL